MEERNEDAWLRDEGQKEQPSQEGDVAGGTPRGWVEEGGANSLRAIG